MDADILSRQYAGRGQLRQFPLDRSQCLAGKASDLTQVESLVRSREDERQHGLSYLAE